MIKIIGVCGNSGSGKSTYSKKLSRGNNALLIDVDKIVHELLETERIKKAVCKLFGTNERKALGNILFADKSKMDTYNKFIYPEIEFIIDRMISAAQGGGAYLVIDWALLPMTKYFNLCTEKHLIKRSLSARKQAVLKRDNIDEEYFNIRESNALQYNESDFDKVIEFEFKNKALFAGTFDPFTLGHLDILTQAQKDFDEVIIGIAVNPDKLRRFDKDSMCHAIKETTNLACVVYSGFTGEQALLLDCYTLIRGIRDESDMLYEKRIEEYNKQNFGLNTVYYYSPPHLKDISSSQIKELMRNNKPIDTLVPKAVHDLVQA